MKNVRERLGRHLAVGAGLFFLDQILKFLVLGGFRFDGGFFEVTLVRNTGAGFGILQGANLALIFVSVAVLGFLLYSWPKADNRMFVTIIASGIVGNLIDRLRLGFVVDWFNLGWFPVFNIADACISIGVLGFVGFSLYKDLRKTKKK
jgi:signal peptidase II